MMSIKFTAKTVMYMHRQ